jgi:hypothetical protein
MFTEDIDEKQLSKNEKLLWRECINAQSWKKHSDNKRMARKKKFNHIITKYGTSKLADVIRQLLSEMGHFATNN